MQPIAGARVKRQMAVPIMWRRAGSSQRTTGARRVPAGHSHIERSGSGTALSGSRPVGAADLGRVQLGDVLHADNRTRAPLAAAQPALEPGGEGGEDEVE